MPYPENPETIILKNRFYPKGLREIDIWNHYRRYKSQILKEVMNRYLMLVIMVNVNKPIMRRKGKEGLIRLMNRNYDEVITGRTITIYSLMRMYEDICVIDIDADNFRQARIATKEVYDFIMDDVPYVRTAQIRFTGKTSFHIVCTLAKKYNINAIRNLLERTLKSSDLINKYTVAPKRTKGVVNLDIWASNKFDGAFITLESLSVIGLRCMEVGYNKILNFDVRRGII